MHFVEENISFNTWKSLNELRIHSETKFRWILEFKKKNRFIAITDKIQNDEFCI